MKSCDKSFTPQGILTVVTNTFSDRVLTIGAAILTLGATILGDLSMAQRRIVPILRSTLANLVYCGIQTISHPEGMSPIIQLS